MAPEVSAETRRIIALFYHKRIQTEAALQEALAEVVALDLGAYDEFFGLLLSPSEELSPTVLAFLLSSTECGDILRRWLMDCLPTQGEHFSTSDIAVRVFTHLSLSIPFLYPFDRKVILELSRHRVQIEHSTVVIDALVRFLQTSTGEDSKDTTPTEDLQFLVKKKQTQKQRKIAQLRPVTIFDQKIIKSSEAINVDLPSNGHDAQSTLQTLVQELYDIFVDYLKLLRKPAVAAALRQAIIYDPHNDDHGPSFEEQNRSLRQEESETQDEQANAPAAFPMVQPMKAALYFESADGFGEWRILISTRASRDLHEFRRRDKKAFTIIIKKIKELSNGHFSDDNQKRLTGVETEVPIYEAKMTRDSRLLYHIDCVPEYESSVERQVIKVFGIYTHAQIDNRLWESVSYQLGKKGSEYKKRCKYRCRPGIAGDNVFAPASFPPLEDEDKKDDVSVPSIPTESLEEIHSLLVLEKFIPFSQALLNTIIADLDVVHVFDVSSQEMEIIQHPYSCYVLGRSGTGKTTTMLFKMLGIQRAYEERKDTMAKPRQIFVTQSRVLAGKVEDYFSKLLNSLLTGKKTKEELAHMIKSKQQQQLDEGLIDVDDEQNWRADLPLRFSELKDEHFPLFLTFDRLAALLEEDLQDSLCGAIVSPTKAPMSPIVGLTPAVTTNKARKPITYETFLTTHWPHISQNLRKGLDPALVYSEVMGVIQGSEESLNHESRYLDEASYKNLSHRTQYAFATRRDVIYSIFQHYIKQKKQSQSYDAADRTHHLLRAISAQGVPGQKLDFLYVDEAQDNLLIDALFLRSLVKNPDGLFWAGDTAQTISVGSSFRFNDLKAFLYRLEQRREQSGAPTALEPPRTFHLAVNYRSHGGIVQCAHSVIELITNFWPYAIDVLSREQGVVDGSKPVFFSGWDSQTVRYEQFLFGETGSPIEFGAQQCILVRNDTARNELRQQVGEIGLILTLYESKGLEFDDVLLYKFFEDSTVDLSQWRVVLNLLQSSCPGAPAFDEIKHAGVCSELKFLYVAVTRARKNLWIVDCSEKGEPMRIFWSSRNEIQHCTPGTDVPRLAVSSTPEEWAKTGRSLFSNKRYTQAMHCYERAGMPREAGVAKTYHLRDEARRAVVTGSKQSIVKRQEAFIAAAQAFLGCAADAPDSRSRATYYRNAGICFEEAENDYAAAEAYRNAMEFTKATKLYRKCGKFDEAVAIITDHREDVEEGVVQNVTDIARLFYFKGGELEKAALLFDSVDEQLDYLEDFDLDVSRAALLEKLGKFREAAEVHIAEGRTFEAIQMFIKDDKDKVAISRGQECILRGLWEQIYYPTPQDLSGNAEEVNKLLRLASAIKSDAVQDEALGDEISMFKAIKLRDHAKLRALARKFDAHGNLTAALLCFDCAFQKLPSMYRMPQADISNLLQDYQTFCGLLFTVTKRYNLLRDDKIRRLFRIETCSENENSLHLPSGTLLHKLMAESPGKIEAVTDGGVQISEWYLSRRLKALLDHRVVAVLKTEIDECKYAQAFSPCHSFISSGGQSCHRKDCPHQHVAPVSLTPAWHTLQIRIHLQQILLLDGLTKVSMPPGQRMSYYRYWIGRLFNTLHPAIYQLGNFANTDPSAIPEWTKAMAVLRTIFGNVFFHTGFTPRDPKLFTTGYQIIRIASYYDKAKAHAAVCHSPFADVTQVSPACVRVPGKPSTAILPEVSCLFSGTYAVGTSWGILVIRHILSNEVQIEATALWDLIDIVAGSIILLHKEGDLHGVQLPLSWLNQLLRVVKLSLSLKPPPQSGTTTSGLIGALVNELLHLLERFIERDKLLGHLKLDSSDRDLANTIPQRNIYISRLCRTLCLIGFNVNNAELNIRIHQSIQRLKQITVHSLNLFRDYAYARSWGGLTRAVQRSVANSPLDEMIQLYHSGKVINSRPAPEHVRRIVYSQVSDIPQLLDGSLVFSNLRASAPEFKPKPRPEEAFETTADDDTDQAAEAPAVDNNDIVNTNAVVEVSSVATVPNQHQPPNQRDIHAAIVCQRSFRRTQRHKAKKNPSSLQLSRQAIFLKCLKFEQSHRFTERSVYRLIYLGPLPHMLASLGAVYSAVMANKKRNTLRLRIAEHLELEELSKRFNEHKKVINEILKLQKTLAPQSDFHSKRDVEELKKYVLQVQDLINRNAPPSVVLEVSQDMYLAHRGIVETKKAPKPKAKPKLIIDDGYDLDEAAISDHSDDRELESYSLPMSNVYGKPMPPLPDVVVLDQASPPLKDDPVSALFRLRRESGVREESSSEGDEDEGDYSNGTQEETTTSWSRVPAVEEDDNELNETVEERSSWSRVPAVEEEEADDNDEDMTEVQADERLEKDVREFFSLKVMNEGYFTDLSEKWRSRLVETLISTVLEKKEVDANLIAQIFGQAAAEGVCPPESFSEGFSRVAEIVCDLAINTPKALDNFAIAVKGSNLPADVTSTMDLDDPPSGGGGPPPSPPSGPSGSSKGTQKAPQQLLINYQRPPPIPFATKPGWTTVQSSRPRSYTSSEDPDRILPFLKSS